MDQVVSAAGAALILLAFWLLQTHRVSPDGRGYQLMNLAGAALLATAAFTTEAWAFVVLNTVWALVALWSLARRG